MCGVRPAAPVVLIQGRYFTPGRVECRSGLLPKGIPFLHYPARQARNETISPLLSKELSSSPATSTRFRLEADPVGVERRRSRLRVRARDEMKRECAPKSTQPGQTTRLAALQNPLYPAPVKGASSRREGPASGHSGPNSPGRNKG